MAADGTITIDTKVDTSGIKSGMSNVEKNLSSIQGVVKKIGKSIAAAFAVREIVNFGRECLELGSDLYEVQNVVDVTFSSMSKQVDDFAKKAAKSYGLSETMAKRYVGTFGSMSKAFGFTEQQAYDMSTALTGLTGDVASFYNLSQDEAYTKLKSVFTGETESLKDLGVVMTQSALDQYALANGYGKTTAKMTEQEKVALRFAFVQKQLSLASGDFIRTSDSWANQVRIMQLQIQSLKATIGQGLSNVFTPVIKVINLFLEKIATAANAFKAFTELLTGKKSQESTPISTAADTMSELEQGYSGVSGGADNMASGAEKAADAIKDQEKETKKAAKAAKSYLSPLDEIHKLNKEDTGNVTGTLPGSGGGGGTITGSAVDFGKAAEGETEIEKVSGAMDDLIKKLKQLKKLFKKGFWEGLGDYKPVLKELEEDFASIGTSIRNIFNSQDVKDAAWGFAETLSLNLGRAAGSIATAGLTVGQNFVGGMEVFFRKNEDRIRNQIIRAFDIGSDIANIAGDVAVMFTDTISSVFGSQAAQDITGSVIGIFYTLFSTVSELSLSFFHDIANLLTKPFVDNKETIRTALMETIEPLAVIAEAIGNFIQQTADKVLTLYDTYLKPFIDSVTEGVSTIFGILLEGYNKYVAPVLDYLAQRFTELLEGPLGDMIDTVLLFLGNLITKLQEVWEAWLVPLLSWIAEEIMPIVGEIIKEAGDLMYDLVETASDVIEGITEVLQGILDFITGIFTNDWDLAFKGMEEILKGFQDAGDAIFKFLEERVFQPFDNFLKNVFEKDWTEEFGIIGNVLNDFFDGAELVWENVKGLFNGIIEFIKKIFARDWEGAWQLCVDAFDRVFSGIVDILKAPVNGVIALLNGLIGTVNNLLGAIESCLKFDFTIPNPFGGTIVDYHWKANLPRIKWRIQPLANGAVIPPNSEFLALLGDQKRGNNIEAPESLIRKIVREESGNGKSGGTYRFVAQVGRRTLFDEMITEAKMRQDSSGKNPFELT